MDELLILYKFLISLLPEPLLLKSLAYAPVVVALVSLAKRIPWMAERRRWAAPVAALALGQGFGYLATGMDATEPLLVVGAGLVIGLAAIGGVSARKNLAQAMSDEPRAPDKVA